MRSVTEIQNEISQVESELASARNELNRLVNYANEVEKEQDSDPMWKAARRQYIDTGDMSQVNNWFTRRDQLKQNARNYELEKRRLENEEKERAKEKSDKKDEVVKNVENALADKLAQEALGLPTAKQDVALKYAVQEFEKKFGFSPDLEKMKEGMGTETNPVLMKWNGMKLQKTFSDADVSWMEANVNGLPPAEKAEVSAKLTDLSKGQIKTDEDIAAAKEEQKKKDLARKSEIDSKMKAINDKTFKSAAEKKELEDLKKELESINKKYPKG